jgi:hypothetical protein
MLLQRLASFRVGVNASRAKHTCLVTLLAVVTPAAPIAARPLDTSSRRVFLLTSDIHFNPMADATLVADLTAADPSQWETILQRTKPAKFSQYGQDTNWWLLQSALDQMRKTLPHPAFVMYTGDLLAHEFPQTYQRITHDSDPEHYRAFVVKTVEFVALELRKRFPDTRILLTPGNNDEDCGNYSVRAGGTFLGDTASLARDLARADESFASEWRALGSYSVPHPTLAGVRILSLNSVFFSNNYHATSFNQACATVPSNGPADLMGWLESNLTKAKQANEQVWLMFHIPPGIDGYMTTQRRAIASESTVPSAEISCADSIVPMWVPAWTAQFDSLLEKFQDTVVASFAGHTHTDDFRLVNSEGVNKAFVLVDPAVSPVYDQNPSFRVVTFNGDGSLANQATYYLTNLRQASSTVHGHWKKEYEFTRKWKVRQLDRASLGAIYDGIRSQPADRDRWLKLYNVSSSAVYVPADSVRSLYCASGELSVAAYAKCYCQTAPAASGSAPNP